jgi:hypothetical protein
VSFFPLVSGSTDQIESGSNPDPKHCFNLYEEDALFVIADCNCLFWFRLPDVEVAIAQLARHEKQQALGPAAHISQATTKLVKAVVFLICSLKETVGHLVLQWRKKYKTATYSTWLNPNFLCYFLGPFAIVAICFLLRVYVIWWTLTLFFHNLPSRPAS